MRFPRFNSDSQVGGDGELDEVIIIEVGVFGVGPLIGDTRPLGGFGEFPFGSGLELEFMGAIFDPAELVASNLEDYIWRTAGYEVGFCPDRDHLVVVDRRGSGLVVTMVSVTEEVFDDVVELVRSFARADAEFLAVTVSQNHGVRASVLRDVAASVGADPESVEDDNYGVVTKPEAVAVIAAVNALIERYSDQALTLTSPPATF